MKKYQTGSGYGIQKPGFSLEDIPTLIEELKDLSLNDTDDYMLILLPLLHNSTSDETIDKLLPLLEIKQHMSTFLHALDNIMLDEMLDDCNNLYYVLDQSGLDKNELLIYLQGITPRPICPDSPTYASHRGKLPKTKIRAFNNQQFPRGQGLTLGLVLNKVTNNQECFCLDYNFGVFENVYIPVIRYGSNPLKGYYGRQELEDPQFTWYYVEPESGIYLFSPRTLISKNKVACLLELIGMDTQYLDYVRAVKTDQPAKIIKELEDKCYPASWNREHVLYLVTNLMDLRQPIDQETLVTLLSKKEKVILGHRTSDNDAVNNYLEVLGSSGEVIELIGANGGFDELDNNITSRARHAHIDVVVLTHQSGNYGRLVSECVDSRWRDVSYSNLYEL
jgi:hypothetical protein